MHRTDRIIRFNPRDSEAFAWLVSCHGHVDVKASPGVRRYYADYCAGLFVRHYPGKGCVWLYPPHLYKRERIFASQ